MEFVCGDWERYAFGFANPNHAAAFICAMLPFCWDWSRYRWIGRGFSGVFLAMLFLTFSRTGMIVLAFSWGMWLWMRRGRYDCKLMICITAVIMAIIVAGLYPRLVLDDSILNRPRIWFAGLRLFAANPFGVGLGNSGAVISAFLLQDTIPEVRTLISSHLTLLVEFGCFVGWVWFAFIILAMTGARRYLRTWIAFVGLVISAGTSTLFDWAVLLDSVQYGGRGWLNWLLSWLLAIAFFILGLRLLFRSVTVRCLICAVGFSAIFIGSVFFAPHNETPWVERGCVLSGTSPRTLVLYDEIHSLRSVRTLLGERFITPIHGVLRFPRDLDWSSIERVVLLGNCREWDYLVKEKGLYVLCSDE